ncbi:hypothetical protein PsalN5692_00676 [Piscirickettsia salmonis]|uniref:hypothetical protein n=1 Tax=Piscirickettsia salmonis TaxID=1238 RepID=UPI0012B8AF6C|nr:hypothetical protein [Piscirickettsia salmonis]QGP49253.1 hypothetical protein PsalN5692_00676 [Piscirickettsia salmonis]
MPRQNVVVLSLDFDGCIGAVVENGDQVQVDRSFVRYLAREVAQFDKAVLMVGSARQSPEVDKYNAEYRGKAKAKYCFPFMENLKVILGAELDRFLLADVYHGRADGASFHEKVGLGYYLFQNGWDFDEKKVSILYAQIHRAALQNPGANIEFKFYDDRLDILGRLRLFFEDNPDLMPSNVRLSLYQSYGSAPAPDGWYYQVQGRGHIDPGYKQTVRALGKKTQKLQSQASALPRLLREVAPQLSELKETQLTHCNTLQDLCFLVSIRQKGGVLNPANATSSADVLVSFLNLPRNYFLRRAICPQGEKVRVRDIRHFALHGHEVDYARVQSGYRLSGQAREEEKHFALTENKYPEQPLLVFRDFLVAQGEHQYQRDSALAVSDHSLE